MKFTDKNFNDYFENWLNNKSIKELVSSFKKYEVKDMEIEVGEYIRTKDGIITKLISSDDKFKRIIIHNTAIGTENIKHSKNIIDLIEVGDYVNGVEVCEVAIEKDKRLNKVYAQDYELEWYEENIKTILTHERYEREAYRVE